MKPFSHGQGVALAVGAAACWSLGGALVRLTTGIDAWQIVFYRSLAVLACMLIWLGLAHGRRLPALIRRAGVNAVIAGIAVAMAGLSFIAALFHTTVAQAIFMVGVAPFFSAMLGFWILRERIPAITWAAMLVALAGMGVLLIGTQAGGSLVGTALALYSAFCFSCYAVLLRWGQRTDMSVALIWNALLLILVAGCVILLPTTLRAQAGIPEFAIGLENLLACLVMGAVQLTLGLVLFTWGSRSVPAAQLSLLALVEPTLSPLWAWLVAGELPPIRTFMGGAIILAAIAVQAVVSMMPQRTGRRARAPAAGSVRRGAAARIRLPFSL